MNHTWPGSQVPLSAHRCVLSWLRRVPPTGWAFIGVWHLWSGRAYTLHDSNVRDWAMPSTAGLLNYLVGMFWGTDMRPGTRFCTTLAVPPATPHLCWAVVGLPAKT